MAVQPNEQINLDSSQAKSFNNFFNSLPQKAPTTVRIFDRSEYYTVHGEDAYLTAKEVYKTTNIVKYYGEDNAKLAYVSLNRSSFEFWVRELLLIRRYRIEIYQNEGTVKNCNWVLRNKASPGNMVDFEDIVFSSTSTSSLTSSGLIAFSVGKRNEQKVVGMAYIDRTSYKFNVCEYTDDDQYSNTESMLVQLSPSECIFSVNDLTSQLKQIFERTSILLTEKKKSDFQATNIVQDLNRLLKFDKGVETCLHLPQIQLSVAMQSLAAIIKFLELLNDGDSMGRFHLDTFDTSQYVRLDNNAVESLQLIPSGSLPVANNFHSLYGVLNRCRTNQGQRLLLNWIKQPLMDLHKIVERHEIVGAFVEDDSLRRQLHEEMLRKVPDFQKLVVKFIRKKATMQDCYRIYLSISKLPQLTNALSNYSGNSSHLLETNFCTPIKDLLLDFTKFQELVEQTMDLTLVDNNEFVIKVDFDENLEELRSKLDTLEDNMKLLVDKVTKQVGATVKLDSNAQHGYFFRVTLKEEKALRGNSKYKIIDANKTGVRFQNSELKSLNEEYVSVRQEYEEQQKKIVEEVIKIAAGYAEPMQSLGEVLANLDVFVSLAVAATSSCITYVKPKILPKGTGIIKLIQSRHPCVELQDEISFVPNDVAFDQENRFLIITGPNMGGKSTYMRTVAVCVLMAQIGSFVPCNEAEISIVDAVLTRIGSEDCHARAMSTFMLEMVEMANMLRVATKDSFLIIDELGRGTSTYDGFGLAWSISEKIAVDIKSYCMFATHFHELTTLAEEVSTVQNLHITASIGQDGPVFLYRVEKGVCDRSYGIHVAELVKFPEDVLTCAKLKAQEFEDFHSSTLLEHNELQGDSKEAVNNRRKSKQEGEQIITDFLQKVKALAADNLNQDEFDNKLAQLKAEVMATNNAFVQDVLNRPINPD